MIILNKRRLIFIVSTVMVSILSFGLTYKIQEQRAISTVALPVSNKVVVLDARTWNAR